jgi:hypothetical protein
VEGVDGVVWRGGSVGGRLRLAVALGVLDDGEDGLEGWIWGVLRIAIWK